MLGERERCVTKTGRESEIGHPEVHSELTRECKEMCSANLKLVLEQEGLKQELPTDLQDVD